MFNYLALPKNPQLNQKARKLRKAGVLSEVIFWQTYKDKQKLGWDIDRQVIIGNYAVKIPLKRGIKRGICNDEKKTL